jgi:hypothetical protein
MERARRISLTMPVADPVLDAAEASLVSRALESMRWSAPDDAALLRAQLARVGELGAALEQSPSLSVPSRFAGAERGEDWFASRLSHLDPLVGDLALPEKAVLARGFLAAKIALLRSFMAALAPEAPGREAELHAGFTQELAQSIYTAVAIEILTDLQWDPGAGEAVQERAAHQLILIWDCAISLEIDDFCPLLEAAWRARSRVAARYGAMLGTAEFLGMVEQDCPPEFLEFFCGDDAGPDESQAFEEFLFNLTCDELTRVRAAMETAGLAVVDASFVTGVLGRSVDDMSRLDDPDALYRSYRRRRTGAEFRRLTGSLGPVRVAEAYLMTYLLRR